MENDNLNDLILPDGVEVKTSHVDEDVDTLLSEKVTALQKMEQLAAELDTINAKMVTARKNMKFINGKCDTILTGSTQIKKVFGDMEAKYIVTQKEVKEFEKSFLAFFKNVLKVEAKKIIENAMYEMNSTRMEQVNKFTYDIKGGFWLSTKFAVWLTIFFVISYAAMVLFCYMK